MLFSHLLYDESWEFAFESDSANCHSISTHINTRIRRPFTDSPLHGTREILGVVFPTYLYIALYWLSSPQDVREIYATKTDSISQRG
jgi:hypothetical protein